MAVAIDLTKGAVTEFSGSTEDDISYAKTFWQSVELQPPMESRLVSSDIKQRLKVAPSGSHSMSLAHTFPEESSVLQKFFDKAHTLQQLDEYGRIQKFIEAREENIELLEKHREERKKKEEISKHKGVIKPAPREAFVNSGMESPFQEDNDYENEVKLLDDFEKSKFGENDTDSDTGDQ